MPRARRFAVLANAVDPFSPAFERLLETSAQGVGVQQLVNKVRPSDDLRAAFAEFAKLRAEGLIIQPSLLSQAVADLALQHRLPSIAGFRAFAENGGLMSYSGDQSENFELAARYVDLILKGAKPAELPAAHATKFELVINLKRRRRSASLFRRRSSSARTISSNSPAPGAYSTSARISVMNATKRNAAKPMPSHTSVRFSGGRLRRN